MRILVVELDVGGCDCWSDLPGAELEWPWSGEAASSVRAVHDGGRAPTFNVSTV